MHLSSHGNKHRKYVRRKQQGSEPHPDWRGRHAGTCICLLLCLAYWVLYHRPWWHMVVISRPICGISRTNRARRGFGSSLGMVPGLEKVGVCVPPALYSHHFDCHKCIIPCGGHVAALGSRSYSNNVCFVEGIPVMSKSLWASYAGSISALGVATCCVLPMTMMLLGLGGSWLAVFGKIAAASYYVLAVASIMLLIAWVIAARKGTLAHLKGWLVGSTILIALAWVIVFNETRINDYLITLM